jgi:parallel beta-helix repeat protein
VSSSPSDITAQLTNYLAQVKPGQPGAVVICLPSGSFTVAKASVINLPEGAVIVAESGTVVKQAGEPSPLLRLSAASLVYGGTWDANGKQAVFRTTDGATDVKVENATVKNGNYGIQIVNQAEATLTNVTATGNAQHGVMANTGGKVTVNGLTANGNGGNGLRVDQADATVKTVTANDNRGTAGIAVAAGSTAALSGVTANGNTGHGVSVSDTAATVADVTASNNGGNGVRVSDCGDEVSLTKVMVSGNAGTAGIAVAMGPEKIVSLARISGAKSSGNAGHGLLISDGSQVTVTGSTFDGNNGYGVQAQASSVDISGSSASDNGRRGIQLSGGSGVISQNQVLRNGADQLTACDMTADDVCHGQGIALAAKASATIKGNTVTGNGNNGIFVGFGSVATLADNNVSGSRYHGIEAQGAGTVVTFNQNNTVSGSGPAPASGIGVYQGAAVKIQGTGNKSTDNAVNGVTANDNSTVAITAAFEASSNSGNGIAVYGQAVINATGALTVNNNGSNGLYANSTAPAVAKLTYCQLTASGNADGPTFASGSGSLAVGSACGSGSRVTVSSVAIVGVVEPRGTVSVTAAAQPADATLAYQWYVGGTAVNRQTGTSYTIRPADAGKTLQVKVVGTKPGYTPSAEAASTAVTVPAFRGITMTPDMTADGKVDIMAVDAAGALMVYPQTAGNKLGKALTVGKGFGDWDLVAPGDFNGDGYADVIGRNRTTGQLNLYPGKPGPGLRAAVPIGKGWVGWQLIAPGDLTGDGNPDLLGVSPTGLLYFYPGNGKGGFSASRIKVGHGWTSYQLLPGGDLNGDGMGDILGISPEGKLFFYPSAGQGYFGTRQAVGKGWTGLAATAGYDFTGDGIPDLIGRTVDRNLWLYPGKASIGFGSKIKLGSGW